MQNVRNLKNKVRNCKNVRNKNEEIIILVGHYYNLAIFCNETKYAKTEINNFKLFVKICFMRRIMW